MKIHFIGIGGIGVSALAQYYLEKAYSVSGSDLVSSEITDLLKEKGVKLFLGKHKAENMPKSPDLVIYSPAVKQDNPELKKAKKIGVKIQSYPQALGDLTKEYFTIAVSGTHGKSTTTSMLALVLIKAGFDPTVIIGTKLKEFGNTNFRMGKSKYLIIEADEWQASFLNYWPKIIILNNIEEEHMDYYKDLNHILETYKEYIGHLQKNGILVWNKDDVNIQKLISSFSAQGGPASGWQFLTKEFLYKQKETEKIKEILKVPGKHNVYNALAVLTTARTLGISDKISFEALSEYRGSWRRFEIIDGEVSKKKITIVSDYGHHPTEVEATLKAVREKFPKRKIYCVFQPHQKQRTFYLFDKFIKVLSSFNDVNIIVTDIYDVVGREKGDISENVSSEKLVESINSPNVIYLAKQILKEYLKKELKDTDILVIMGAGDIYELVDNLS